LLLGLLSAGTFFGLHTILDTPGEGRLYGRATWGALGGDPAWLQEHPGQNASQVKSRTVLLSDALRPAPSKS
jgi:hypothetical protein